MTFDDLRSLGLDISLERSGGFVIYVVVGGEQHYTFTSTYELDAFVIGYLAGRASAPQSPKEKLPVVDKRQVKEALTSVIDAFWGGPVPQIS